MADRSDKGLPGLGGFPAGQATEVPAEVFDVYLSPIKEELVRLGQVVAFLADGNSSAAIEQIQGQLRQVEGRQMQFEAACAEYRNAIIQMQQQIQTIARNQVQGGTRALAASLAVQAKVTGESHDKLMGNAEGWYKFLNKDNPPAVSVPIHTGNSVEDPSPTTH